MFKTLIRLRFLIKEYRIRTVTSLVRFYGTTGSALITTLSYDILISFALVLVVW